MAVYEGGSKLVPIREASIYRNEPFIPITAEEIVKLTSRLKFALVGKFSYSKPARDEIHHALATIGFRGYQFFIGFLEVKHIIINFAFEDYARLFMKPIWIIKGFPMRILKYTYNFETSTESLVVPILIALPKQSLIYYDKAILYSIAVAIGKPLKIDEPIA